MSRQKPSNLSTKYFNKARLFAEKRKKRRNRAKMLLEIPFDNNNKGGYYNRYNNPYHYSNRYKKPYYNQHNTHSVNKPVIVASDEKDIDDDDDDNITIVRSNISVIAYMEELLHTDKLVYVSSESRSRAFNDMKKRMNVISKTDNKDGFDDKIINEEANALIKYSSIEPLRELWDHQKVAVKFMEWRENDRDNINCYGGLVSDEMGLGKTLVILKRILDYIKERYKETNERFNGATLIVAPKTILDVWGNEIVEFFSIHTFECKVLCENENTHMSVHDIESCVDIVLTTYPTLTYTYKSLMENTNKEGESEEGEKTHKYKSLFDVNWTRIICDEAHAFVNRKSIIFSAITSLKSKFKWYLSGTPIQNYAVDLYSAFTYIGVPEEIIPYSLRESVQCSSRKTSSKKSKSKKRRRFNFDHGSEEEEEEDRPEQQTLNIKKGDDERIRAILKKVMIRRLKDDVNEYNVDNLSQRKSTSCVISLEPLDISIELIEFEYPQEKELYHTYNTNGFNNWVSYQDGKIKKDKRKGCSEYYRIIHTMRQLCISPRLVKNLELPKGMLALGMTDKLKLDNAHTEIISKIDEEHDEEEEEEEEKEWKWEPYKESNNVNTSSKLYLRCHDVLKEGHDIDRIDGDVKIVRDNIKHLVDRSVPRISTKYKHVIEYILSIPKEDKVVVFSDWVTALNILSEHFEENNISYISVNGSMTTKKRNISFRSFRKPGPKVLLLSLRVGKEGLNLTVANHAIILGPWWNPWVEEQAISRLHRSGQKKKVRVKYFIIKGTIEEYVMEVARDKKVISQILLRREDNNNIIANKDDISERTIKMSPTTAKNDTCIYNSNNRVDDSSSDKRKIKKLARGIWGHKYDSNNNGRDNDIKINDAVNLSKSEIDRINTTNAFLNAVGGHNKNKRKRLVRACDDNERKKKKQKRIIKKNKDKVGDLLEEPSYCMADIIRKK